MIELTKYQVKTVSGGMYYTVLGTTLGTLATAGWAASMVGMEGFSEKNQEVTKNLMIFFGMIGGAFGSVVGACLDNINI